MGITRVSLRLGFARRHGIGMELVGAMDLGTTMRAPTVTVKVNPASALIIGHLTASLNPVMKGGTTFIVGTGFIRNTLVRVRWSRPDGTHGTRTVLANGAGEFAFRLVASTRHGCGTRTFVATDLATGAHSPPLVLAETCSTAG